jgi:hypothetical protein
LAERVRGRRWPSGSRSKLRARPRLAEGFKTELLETAIGQLAGHLDSLELLETAVEFRVSGAVKVSG